MTTGKRSFHNRLSLKSELFGAFVLGFVFFLVGRLFLVSWTYSGNVERTYMEQVVSTSEQAVSNYATYTSDVVNVSDAIQKRLVNENDTTIKEKASDFFDDTRILSPSIGSISLYDGQGVFIAGNSNYLNDLSPASVVSQSWFSSARTSPLINIFSRVDSASFFTLSKLFTYGEEQKKAVLKIVYDFSGIESRIDETRLGDGGHVYIFDNDLHLVYSSGAIGEKEPEIIQETIIGNKIYEENGNSYFLFLSTIPKTRWRVAIVTNINELYLTKKNFFINCIVFSIIVLALFLLVFYHIASQISTPLVRLQKEMENVENLDFQVQKRKNIGGTKEIQSLNNSFNLRRQKIHDLAKEVVQEQKERTKSELKALQNQINPHFLYNTLDSIIYRIDEGKNEQAQERIVALSRFFRISISRGKNIIPVKSELDHVKYYLQMQKMRFGETFSFDIQAEPEILDLPIIKLILQPIVENAIVHGFGENAREQAAIHIQGGIKDEFLVFDIIDNGMGRLPEKQEELLASFKNKNIHQGVGLSNVYQRIHIFYGEKADIGIESKPDAGTKIEIRIPLSEVKDNEE